MLKNQLKEKMAAASKAIDALAALIGASEHRLTELENAVPAAEKRFAVVELEFKDKENKLKVDLDKKIHDTESMESNAKKRLADAMKRQDELTLMLNRADKLEKENIAKAAQLAKKEVELSAKEELLNAKLKAVEDLKATI